MIAHRVSLERICYKPFAFQEKTSLKHTHSFDQHECVYAKHETYQCNYMPPQGSETMSHITIMTESLQMVHDAAYTSIVSCHVINA